eukprot:6340073-Amphidinium_carterae.1
MRQRSPEFSIAALGCVLKCVQQNPVRSADCFPVLFSPAMGVIKQSSNFLTVTKRSQTIFAV